MIKCKRSLSKICVVLLMIICLFVSQYGFLFSGEKTILKIDNVEKYGGNSNFGSGEVQYLNISSNTVALMSYYMPNAQLTLYGDSTVGEITLYAKEAGTINIGTAKVSDIVNARKNGTTYTSDTKQYSLVKGSNTVKVNLEVEDDETIVLGGNNSVAIGYTAIEDATSQDGLFTLVDGSSHKDVLNASSKLEVVVNTTCEVITNSTAFIDINTFLNAQTNPTSTAAGNPSLFPIFYNTNDPYANSKLTKLMIYVNAVSALDVDQTITLHVADKSILSSKDVTSFMASDKVKSYQIVIPSETFSSYANTKISNHISVDISSYNISVGSDEVIGFGTSSDTIGWNLRNSSQNSATKYPELYLSYTASNVMTNGNGSYSMLFNFETQKVSSSSRDEQARIDDITERETIKLMYKALNGKNFSILGDSISTYKGYSNNATYTNSTIGSNNVYYNGSNGLTGVNDTWWMQTVNTTGMNLLVNNSWSGSFVTGSLTSKETGVGTRTQNLHDDTGDNAGTNPDIIAIYMGTNDLSRSVGDYSSSDFYDTLYADENATTFARAYAIMLDKVKKAYPNADIFTFTILANNWVNSSVNENINNAIKSVSEHYGATVVDIYSETGITSSNAGEYMLSNESTHIHPNEAGMTKIANTFMKVLSEKYKYVEDEDDSIQDDVTINNPNTGFDSKELWFSLIIICSFVLLVTGKVKKGNKKTS